MATDKRARQRANRQEKIEQLNKEEERAKRQRWILRGAIGAAVLIGILLLINFLGGNDEETATEDESAETSTDQEAGAETSGDNETADGEAASGSGGCVAPADQVLSFDEAPEFELAEGATYSAVLDTSAGEMTIALDAEQAPNIVNNFVFLARSGFYDCVTFHRVIEDFMIQGGDPVGDPPGTGGPGYQIDDELPEAGEYQLGSVAMANSGPNTNGSQFFIVTGPNGEALPPQYSLFGTVTQGLDVATAIQGVDTDINDKPLEDVIINSVTISET